MYGTRNFELVPVAPAALATLADVKSMLGISGADSDALLNRYIAAASAAVEGFCDTIFSQRAVTETLFLHDSITDLVLQFSPAITLTEVKFEKGADTKADFELFKRGGLLRRVDGTSIEAGRYDVAYTAGYAAGTIPAAVGEAVILHVRDLYNSKDRKAGVARESVPDVSDVTYSTDYLATGANGVRVSAEVASLLEPLRRRFNP